ncbi:UDP-glucosyl transferase 78D3 [Actinidia rufa]|uniref:Glycosyltransferase n=1 Tax=Actinidia rufa TaxID=165716 RepID=A0A7J0DZW2_9ERIC|nr:UDP-glucosyl transferase 78D3 [Actinidia rufa]
MANSSTDRHVAILVFPFASHIGILLSLVRRLAAAAPDTTFSFYNTTNESLFSGPNPENIKPIPIWDGVPDGYVFTGNIEDTINLFLETAEEAFKGAMRIAEAETGRRIGCVMGDAILSFACDVAEEMGVPWVPLWVSGSCSLSIHYYTDLIRKTVGIHDVGHENELLKFIPGFPELRLGDLPGGVLFGNLESPFSIMLHKMGKTLPKAAAVLVNSFEELEPELNKDLNSKFRKLLNVGPLNLTSPPPSPHVDKYGCIPWLEERKAASVAYISFGTVAQPTPDEVVALAKALEASGTPFLWSIKDNLKEQLPEGFLKRTSEQGKIVAWAPQLQVLSHSSTGVFITQCGWGSMLESIAAGIPMIGRPVFGDHHINGWMMENVLKIGVRVEGGIFTESATMRALELVLSRESGKNFKEQIGHVRELALKAVEPKGSSSENLKTLLDIIVTGQNF